jgi:hypothetical protein
MKLLHELSAEDRNQFWLFIRDGNYEDAVSLLCRCGFSDDWASEAVDRAAETVMGA